MATKFEWIKNMHRHEKTIFFTKDEIVDDYTCPYHTYIHLRNEKTYLMVGVYSDDDLKTMFKKCREWCRGMKEDYDYISFAIYSDKDDKRYPRYIVA